MAHHITIGKIGENIALTFLMKHGYTILQTNYHVQGGEVDIIAEKDKVLRFVEVKSVKVKSFGLIHTLHVKPEDNVTLYKWGNILFASHVYLKTHNVPHETKWQVDLACIYIHEETRQGKVIYMENIHI